MRTSRIAALLTVIGLTFAGSTALAQESDSEQKAQKEADSETTSAEQKAAGLLDRAQTRYLAGEWYEAREFYRKAYEAAPADSAVRVEATLGRSTLLWEQGNYPEASKYIGEALELAKKLKLNGAVGRLLLTLGHTQASQGRLGTAEQTLSHCVDLAAEQNDPVFGPLCKLNHRMVRKLQGKSVGSEAEYKQAIKQLQSNDSPLTVGLSLAKTAEFYAQGGQRGKAFQLLDQADAQYDKAGSVPARARNKMLKARFLQESGKWGEARGYLKGLLEQFKSMGSKPAVVDVYGLLGNDAQQRGAYGEASGFYQNALETAKSTGSPQLIAKVQLALCDVYARAGKAGGNEYCKGAIATFEQLGMPQLAANGYSSQGKLAQNTANLELARDAFLSALELREEEVHAGLRDKSKRVYDLSNLCQVEMRLQIQGAYHRCREAKNAIKEADPDNEQMMAATYYAVGNAAANEGNIDEATTHLKKAADYYEKMKPAQPAMVGDVYLRLGAVFTNTDRAEKAADAYKSGLDAVVAADDEALLGTLIQLRTQYAQTKLNSEKWKTAAKHLTELAEEARRADDTATHAWAYSALARAQNNLEQYDEAKTSLEKALPLAKKAGDKELVKTIKSNLDAF